mmetsp:Transcript_37625/g.91451  ORF Transcript_37625/g.91451 Transcript_37625/m.91451 type:complete len:99 (-) Transcript_37625:671-967(-)
MNILKLISTASLNMRGGRKINNSIAESMLDHKTILDDNLLSASRNDATDPIIAPNINKHAAYGTGMLKCTSRNKTTHPINSTNHGNNIVSVTAHDEQL